MAQSTFDCLRACVRLHVSHPIVLSTRAGLTFPRVQKSTHTCTCIAKWSWLQLFFCRLLGSNVGLCINCCAIVGRCRPLLNSLLLWILLLPRISCEGQIHHHHPVMNILIEFCPRILYILHINMYLYCMWMNERSAATTHNHHHQLTPGEECLYLILRCNLLLFFVILLLYFIYLIFIYAPVFVYFLCKRWRSKVAISNKTHTHAKCIWVGEHY